MWSEIEVRVHLLEIAEVKRGLVETCMDSILDAAELVAGTFRSGGKVLLCGNGGRAADCQYMAAEFVRRLTKDFERPGLAAMALTTDTSFLTAFANECGFEGVFEGKVQTLGRPGDARIGSAPIEHILRDSVGRVLFRPERESAAA